MTAPQWLPLQDDTESPLVDLRSRRYGTASFALFEAYDAATRVELDYVRRVQYASEGKQLADELLREIESEWLCRICGGTTRTCECQA